jgi:hypothetical protein
VAQHDLSDIARFYPGIGKRIAGNPGDQALDRLAFKPAEGGMGPSDNAGGDDRLPAVS